jgi:alpha,alpha-trehalase
MAEQASQRTRDSEDHGGVYDDAKTYYTSDTRHTKYGPRTRTYSQNSLLRNFDRFGNRELTPFRRGSHGASDLCTTGHIDHD